MKLPAFQFYPADWRKDPAVQSLSYHDRGVWFEILCLMHESEQRGKLLLNGKPMPEDALARLLGLDKQNLTKTLTTLLDYGVASRCEETGALMNRRMVRDEELRKIRQEAGRKGGNPVLLNQNANQNPTTPVKQKSTPSSSSSSSKKKELGADAPPPKIPQDERSKHPAILVVKEIIRQFPSRLNWDEIISLLGTSFDEVRLKRCASEWVKRGYNLRNLNWLTEWYVSGIPAQRQTQAAMNAPGRGPVF
jgi:hypothetical protein